MRHVSKNETELAGYHHIAIFALGIPEKIQPDVAFCRKFFIDFLSLNLDF